MNIDKVYTKNPSSRRKQSLVPIEEIKFRFQFDENFFFHISVVDVAEL